MNMAVTSTLYFRFFLLVISCFCLPSQASSAKKPNIMILLADDLGWADLQEHDHEMKTPAIASLRSRGIFLNQSYVMPTCAPTRSAILTGRYPYKFGMQLNTIKGTKMSWLEEDLTIIPQEMKKLGYSTHAIGKWHLGYCNWAITPTYRGFDTFYGFYGGAQGFFNHSGERQGKYDFRDGIAVADKTLTMGKYSTELHTARAQKIIRESDDPFFMYFAYQNVHAPFEAKQYYVDKYCSHVKDKTRRIHCGMVAAMDESIANLTQTLRDVGKLDDTIIVFLSDNGGPINGGSINFPLRGQKSTLWEGGTRSYTVISHPSVNRGGETYSGIVHAIDWFPTLLQAAGGRSDLAQFDGIPMWKSIKNNQPSPRKEFLYNYDDQKERLALRWNQWKLTVNRPGRKYNGWYPSPSQQKCGAVFEEPEKHDVEKDGLFNIEQDPEERYNVIDEPANSVIVESMRNKLENYKKYLCKFTHAESSQEGNHIAMSNDHVVTPGFCRIPQNSRYKTKCTYALTDTPSM